MIAKDQNYLFTLSYELLLLILSQLDKKAHASVIRTCKTIYRLYNNKNRYYFWKLISDREIDKLFKKSISTEIIIESEELNVLFYCSFADFKSYQVRSIQINNKEGLESQIQTRYVIINGKTIKLNLTHFIYEHDFTPIKKLNAIKKANLVICLIDKSNAASMHFVKEIYPVIKGCGFKHQKFYFIDIFLNKNHILNYHPINYADWIKSGVEFLSVDITKFDSLVSAYRNIIRQYLVARKVMADINEDDEGYQQCFQNRFCRLT